MAMILTSVDFSVGQLNQFICTLTLTGNNFSDIGRLIGRDVEITEHVVEHRNNKYPHDLSFMSDSDAYLYNLTHKKPKVEEPVIKREVKNSIISELELENITPNKST